MVNVNIGINCAIDNDDFGMVVVQFEALHRCVLSSSGTPQTNA